MMKQLTFVIVMVLVFHQMLPALDKGSRKSYFRQLSCDDYEIAIPFFQDFHLFETILLSILKNRIAGDIFIENASNPSFVLVCSLSTAESPNAYAYLAGKCDDRALEAVASLLKTFPKISLVCPLDWQYREFFEKKEGFTAVERLQLRRPSFDFDVSTWEKLLPIQYSLSPIDGENLAKCNWYQFMLCCYGDIERFIANGKGFCLLDKGKIVSESYAFIVDDKAEIGVVTDTNYRSLGLGTGICAVMLDYCYKNNLEPCWNCDLANPSSAAIAKKLGFQEEARYLFLKWKNH